MKKHLMISAVVLGLTACGGDEATIRPSPELEASRQGLVYAYPAHEQLEVPTPAPIVLRFSSAVVDSNPEMFITVRDANGDEVPYSIETGIGDGQGLVLTPDERLAPRSEYTVEIDGITLERGAAQPRTLTFTTKGLTEGPRELVMGVADENGDFADFDLLRKIPDGNTLPIMDFSSFRLQFNQPLDRTTVNYGSSVALEGPDGVVDAHLIVHGPYMTVDPKEDLTPGVEYTLSLHSDITSTYGDAFSSNSYTFTPLDSGSRSYLTQEVSEGTSVSMLTGKPVNMVPLEAVLLGDDNQTQQSGFLQAELAHIPTHPDFAPLRIKRGSMLSGTDMEVLIGGEVPAGFSSGEVKIHFISDAVGYLERNPYFEAGEAPQGTRRQLRLFMDVAITAKDPRANGAVTQDLMHLELVGTAEIREGRLVADAVSVAEPKILGSENARSVLSFFMQSSLVDQHEKMEDPGELVLQSWVIGSGDVKIKNGDPIVFNFNFPLAKTGSALLTENGAGVDISYYMDGASLVVIPDKKMEYYDEASPIEYTINLSGLAGVNGSVMESDINLNFKLNNKVTLRRQLNVNTGMLDDPEPVEKWSPVILASYPGFPCAVTEENILAGTSGRCSGGFPGFELGTVIDHKPADDFLPIMSLPSNRPIIVIFSKDIDENSVSLGGSFAVQELDEAGGPIKNVPGNIEVSGNRITFYPDNEWESGILYRYVLGSNDDPYSSSANCDGGQAICDTDGLPLKTELFADLEFSEVFPPPGGGGIPAHSERDYIFDTTPKPVSGGGPSVVQHFYGAERSSNVMQVLLTSPSSDTNSNFISEVNYPFSVNVAAGLMPVPLVPLYSYESGEELNAKQQPLDDRSDPVLDPNGVLPPPNSAKILSRDTEGSPPDANFPIGRDINGVNIGCGYQGSEAWDSSMPNAVYLIPYECPDQKFTFLKGGLIAEVTDFYDDVHGLKVKIWPGQIMSTALPVYARLFTGSIVTISDSGAQIMRMRYEEDETGNRVNPITGWIQQDQDGNATFNATVDLYLDAVEMSSRLPVDNPTHALISYPITMELSGAVNFLDDGRMVVEQYNTNIVDIDVPIHASSGVRGGEILLRIPEYGSRLNYVSEVIKK